MIPVETLVERFHRKFGFPVGRHVSGGCEALAQLAPLLDDIALELREEESLEAQRASLMLEELGEIMQAMFLGDEVGVLDGLADLAYVTVGTAVAYDLPLEAAFSEVHRSNMSKTPGGFKPEKGRGFFNPDLVHLINERRASRRVAR